jgi:hypothetical protein
MTMLWSRKPKTEKNALVGDLLQMGATIINSSTQQN